ncbi:MAG: hypothetical protein JWO67_4868 [Streptosporangiaceae bacterium]|nr:hypothetical protein [Streptosporangiaceae bacterium]
MKITIYGWSTSQTGEDGANRQVMASVRRHDQSWRGTRSRQHRHVLSRVPQLLEEASVLCL